jgi:hypothetical protein
MDGKERQMRARHRRQAQRGAQLELFGEASLREALPEPNAILDGMLNRRGQEKPKIVSLGLTLYDLARRTGPAEYEGHAR